MPAPMDCISVVRQVFLAFSHGDMTALEPLLAPHVTWYVHGENAISGTYRNREATFAMFGRLYRATEGTFCVTPYAFAEVLPGTVIAMARLCGSGHGISIDEKIVQEFEVHDGQIQSSSAYLKNGYLFDMMLGRPVIDLTASSETAAVR
jgi:uncharacterized protein